MMDRASVFLRMVLILGAIAGGCIVAAVVFDPLWMLGVVPAYLGLCRVETICRAEKSRIRREMGKIPPE